MDPKSPDSPHAHLKQNTKSRHRSSPDVGRGTRHPGGRRRPTRRRLLALRGRPGLCLGGSHRPLFRGESRLPHPGFEPRFSFMRQVNRRRAQSRACHVVHLPTLVSFEGNSGTASKTAQQAHREQPLFRTPAPPGKAGPYTRAAQHEGLPAERIMRIMQSTPIVKIRHARP